MPCVEKTVADPEEQRVKKAQLEAGGAEVIRQSAQRGGGDREDHSKKPPSSCVSRIAAPFSPPPRCFFFVLNIQIQKREMIGWKKNKTRAAMVPTTFARTLSWLVSWERAASTEKKTLALWRAWVQLQISGGGDTHQLQILQAPDPQSFREIWLHHLSPLSWTCSEETCGWDPPKERAVVSLARNGSVALVTNRRLLKSRQDARPQGPRGSAEHLFRHHHQEIRQPK